MRRPSVPAVVVVIVLALLLAWVASKTEWGEVKLPTPLRGDAATNPFYAAQRLVDTLGATSEVRQALGATSSNAVVVLSTWAWDITDGRRAELEKWVEGGGRLVVDAALITGSDAFERWSGIAREREERDPGDEDLFRPPEVVEPCAEFTAVRYDTGEADERGNYELCDYDHASWLVPTSSDDSGGLVWGLGDDETYLQAARVSVGEGTVTVVNAVPFVYRALFDGDHGELLFATADLRAGDHVVFMSEADVPSLLELVWRHGAPVIAVLAVFIALGLWRGAMRFGPLAPPVERVRRSLAEQILGTGRFAVRVGNGGALLAAARRALHEAAARRIVGYERLAPAKQIDAVARLAAVNAVELGAAMDSSPNQRSLELRGKLALLESARRQLVSGSQWSKHGKRI
jgi:hypothetical protein